MKEKSRQKDKHIFQFMLLTILAFVFYSCEYESDDDNYIHVDKPESNVYFGIDLAGVNPEEIIYVYNNSRFSYTLYTDNKEILVRKFFLDGQPLETDVQSDVAYLNTNIKDKDIHELKLVIAVRTGSESLAEYAGLEMYTGEFTFKIKFLDYTASLNIRETTNNEGYLKIEWDKPKDYEVLGYDVYWGEPWSGKIVKSINNPDETHYIDPEYVYGYKHFTIVAKVKNSFDMTVQDNINIAYTNLIDKDFETYRISKNEAFIKWTNPNPFPCKYVFTYGSNETKVVLEKDNEGVIIPISDFPTWSESFEIYILPKTADSNRYKEYNNIRGSYKDKSIDYVSFNEDLKNQKLQVLSFNTLNSLDISSMNSTSLANHNLQLHTGCKVRVAPDGTVAIDDSDGFINIYSDYTLKNKISKFHNQMSYPFHIISNSRLLINERNGLKIYDTTTNSVVYSKQWTASTTNGEVTISSSVSSDGKYIGLLCKQNSWSSNALNWIELLHINNNDISLVHKFDLETNVEAASINPIKPTNVIVQNDTYYDKKFTIIDLITKEKKEIKGEFMNVDPFTGNILYKGETYGQDQIVHILDNTYSKELIHIELAHLAVSGPLLYNNHIHFSSYYLNLNSLKEWNQ